eukprot:214925_1
MRHTKEYEFIRHLMRWIQSNAYDWDSLENDLKCNRKGNIYHFLLTHDKQKLFDALRAEYVNDSNVAAINFGISVLMWFKLRTLIEQEQECFPPRPGTNG